MNKLDFIKHLVECNCILPQFFERSNPPFHRFVVFSVINQNGEVVPSYAQCNNCGVIHRVNEINSSKILPKESSGLLPKVSEIKHGMPKEIIDIIEAYNPDINTWQEARFIWENELWGRNVILTKEEEENTFMIKYLRILGQNLFKVETSTISNGEASDE